VEDIFFYHYLSVGFGKIFEKELLFRRFSPEINLKLALSVS